MLGQVAHTSLVSDDPAKRRKTRLWFGALTAGLLSGSLAIPAAVAVAGDWIGLSRAEFQVRVAIFVFALLILGGFDIYALVWKRSFNLTLRRQTPKAARTRFRRDGLTALFWGADIGTGVTTYRATSAIWVILMAVFLHLAPFYLGALYGIGLASTLIWLASRKIVGVNVHDHLSTLMAYRRRLQILYVVGISAIGAATVLALVV